MLLRRSRPAADPLGEGGGSNAPPPHALPTNPPPERGARVSIEIERIDLLEADIRARYVELLASDSADEALDEVEEDTTGA